MRTNFFSIIFLFILCFQVHSKEWVIFPSNDAQDEIQTAMILAKPGDTIYLKSGTYNLNHGLSLDVDNILLKGDGLDKTVLNFKKQKTGAQGLLVTSDNVVLKNFAVENALGDAIKSKGSKNIKFINLRTEWTNGPDTKNGAYGLYPVESEKVLIDGCIAIGASDAGIYVGQSEQIIVRNSEVYFNVAGIEIENSYYADVYNNKAENNTAGILVFDLPDLPKQGGKYVRVFNNISSNNNTENFAPEGNIVGTVPKGTGLIIRANRYVEVFQNTFENNSTIGVALVAGDLDSGDESYDPYPRNIQIYNNFFANSGFDPDYNRGDLPPLLVEIAGGVMPDIMWDGILPFWQSIFGQSKKEKLVLDSNNNAKFLNIDVFWYLVFSWFHSPERNPSDYFSEVSNLDEVSEW
tara:strand:+ start:970 stop:2190 length:1221 start_codon:yes stop_codon:yes gene_type:complete